MSRVNLTKKIILVILLSFLPARAVALTVWVLGDSNSGGLYLALVFENEDNPPIIEPHWDIVNYAQGAATSEIGLELTRDLLETETPPDMVILTYGGADALNSCVYGDESLPDQAIENVLEMRHLFVEAGTVVILGKSLKANPRVPAARGDFERRDILRCMSKKVRYIRRNVKRGNRPTLSFRVGSNPERWWQDGIHANFAGYRKIAKRAVRAIRRQERLLNRGF